jgi:predicted PurR-regulated permease PerM
MNDVLPSAKAWLTFAGLVLVVAVLYWTQAVVVPIALAVLLTFLLSRPVTRLQRAFGRVPGVLVVVLVTFAALGLAGWAVTQQVTSLVAELPGYQANVRDKIRDIRNANRGGSVETIQETVEGIEAELSKGETRGTSAQPVVVRSEQVGSLWGLPTAIGPWLEPLATAALVMTLVIFMLLERLELRNRLISLFGQGHVAVTTRAFDEAGSRVSRYLLSQSLINLAYGGCVGAGLYFIGVPYFVLWAALSAALRFIPYVGPWIAFLAPVLVSLAAFEGWTRPLLVTGLFVALELFTNLVVEARFYAGAAGVSQVGLLTAVAFWTWLWGPLGLLMATPLTVCIVVLGKYVPGFEFLSTLMSDATPLDAHTAYYQRLLAGDHAEAADLVEQHLRSAEAETLYDHLMLPALNYAERDRAAGRLSADGERAVVAGTRELLGEVDELFATDGAAGGDAELEAAVPVPAAPIRVLGFPAHGEADDLALQLFARLLAPTPLELEVLATGTQVVEVLRVVNSSRALAICIADLPPSGASRSRYLVKRLRASAPELKILVGRWAPSEIRDAGSDDLKAVGADYVGSTLLETRAALCKLLDIAAPSTPPPRQTSDGTRSQTTEQRRTLASI